MSSPTYDEILRTAQSLTESERIQLGEALLSSMEPISAAPLDDRWLAEIDRRSNEIDSGEAQTVPWSQVRQRARERAKLNG